MGESPASTQLLLQKYFLKVLWGSSGGVGNAVGNGNGWT
jgi:hypothetical protein